MATGRQVRTERTRMQLVLQLCSFVVQRGILVSVVLNLHVFDNVHPKIKKLFCLFF